MPGIGRPPGMHWANLKARTWTKIALFPQRPGEAVTARGGAGAAGKEEAADRGSSCSRAPWKAGGAQLGHEIARPVLEEGPTLLAWACEAPDPLGGDPEEEHTIHVDSYFSQFCWQVVCG